MRTRYRRGTTAQNNALTLPEGQLSIDEEKKAVRLHDGVTPGGFELVGTQVVETPTAGDLTAGFYGEIPGTEFIEYDDLASQIGLSEGISQFNAESNWLKFALDGKTLYVAKKTIRHSISWEQIYQAGAVYGVDGFGSNPSGGNVDQGTIVTIGGKDYRVRLLKGANEDNFPEGYNNLLDPDHAATSEWNRLIYPVHQNTPGTQVGSNWASYADSDIWVGITTPNDGRWTWCQEMPSSNTTYRLARGYSDLTQFNAYFRDNNTNLRGWRPVLELVM